MGLGWGGAEQHAAFSPLLGLLQDKKAFMGRGRDEAAERGRGQPREASLAI